MRNRHLFRAASVVGFSAALAFATPSMAADIIVGTDEGGNCYPFACFAGDNGGSTYQELYQSSAFPGQITFNNLTFFVNEGSGAVDTATYALAFYLTPNSSLSGNLADNRGSLLASFGTFQLGPTISNTLSLTGSSINYDPSLGNLLLQVDVSNLTASAGYATFFQAGGSAVQRAYASDGSGTGSVDGSALVTQFSNVSIGAVPEPATWLMLLVGFGLVGGALRYRRRKTRVSYAMG